MSQAPQTGPDSPTPDPSAEPRQGLPSFLGSNPAPASPPSRKAEPVSNVQFLLMVMAILVVGFVLFRTIAMPGGGGETGYSWEVTTADGSPVDLERYRGRPVVLNVWATWCGPCMMEMPSLIALANRPELLDADVAVVLVSTDGDPEPVRGFLDRTDTGKADVLVASGPPPEEFRTSGIPATFVIDPDGRIVRREIGAMDWNTDAIADELVSLKKTR
jgi:thiol-disulfide isomerase/thioredoxin